MNTCENVVASPSIKPRLFGVLICLVVAIAIILTASYLTSVNSIEFDPDGIRDHLTDNYSYPV